VSSTCKLEDGTINGKPALNTVFVVTTTVTDKSSGDTPPSYSGMSFIDYQGRARGRGKPYLISKSGIPVVKTGTMENELDLCANLGPLIDGQIGMPITEQTVSLNSLIQVHVANSKGGTFYGAKCGTDEWGNGGKVLIHYGDLDFACNPPPDSE
jgi:hypothetical protein